MAKQHIDHVVTAEQAGRVDHLVAHLTTLTREQVRRLIQHGSIHVNGVACPRDFERVNAGDRVELTFDPHNIPRARKGPWRDAAFEVVYEDDDLLVVDKVAGYLTVPTGPAAHDANTLERRIDEYVRRGGRNRGPRGVVVVHRLDQDTSGLLVFAKADRVAQRLKLQFAQRKPLRRYDTLVRGLVADDKGTFRSHLATADNLDRYSVPPGHGGELAVTHYTVVDRFDDFTWVQCELETGRRNQIRVHFAEAGHPVLGDPRYRPTEAAHPKWRVKRLALHASTLGFTHPTTGEPMRFESPLPAPMRRMVGV